MYTQLCIYYCTVVCKIKVAFVFCMYVKMYIRTQASADITCFQLQTAVSRHFSIAHTFTCISTQNTKLLHTPSTLPHAVIIHLCFSNVEEWSCYIKQEVQSLYSFMAMLQTAHTLLDKKYCVVEIYVSIDVVWRRVRYYRQDMQHIKLH